MLLVSSSLTVGMRERVHPGDVPEVKKEREITHHARLGPAGDLNSDLLQAALEPTRELVHGRQEGEVVRECVGGGRGHETGLAHAPTKQLPEPASLLEECRRPNKT